MKMIHIEFEAMPELSEHFKEQLGLGSGSLYSLTDGNYVMRYGSKCGCHGHEMIWKLDSTGKVIQVLDSLPENLVDLYKFNLPERITKNYFKF